MEETTVSEIIEVNEEQGLALYEAKAVQRIDPFKAQLNKLCEDYKDTPDLATTAGYKKAKEGIKAFRDLKGDIEEDRKIVKSRINELAKTVDTTYNALWSEAEKEQLERDAKLKAFDAEKDRLKKEKEEAEEKLRLVRIEELHKLGAAYDGKYYILGDAKIEYDLIKKVADELWENEVLSLFTAAHATIEAERLRIENERKEAQEKQERDALDLIEKQKQLQKEQEDLKWERFQLRRDRLLALGMSDFGDKVSIPKVFSLPTQDIMDLENADFNGAYNAAVVAINEAKQAEENEKELKRIAEERKQIFNERFPQLADATYAIISNTVYAFDGSGLCSEDTLIEMAEDEFKKLVKGHNAANKEAKEKAEQVRLAEVERQRIANEQAALEKSRLQMLSEVGINGLLSSRDFKTMTDNEWKQFYYAAKEVYDENKKKEWLAEQEREQERKELLEKERVADLSDKQKWYEWRDKLTKFAAEIPEFKTMRYNNMKTIALEKFSEIHQLKANKISTN